MKKRTGSKIVKSVVAAMLTMSLTGCLSAQQGAPHPFATMFRDYPHGGKRAVSVTEADIPASAALSEQPLIR